MLTVLTKKIRFLVSPSELFPIFAAAESLSRATGFRSKGDAAPGVEFSYGNGAFRGKTLYTEQNKLIVQTWRASDWPRDSEDSIVVLRFVASPSGTELQMIQSGVPEGSLPDLKSRWNSHYWKPIKRYLKELKAAATPPKPRGRPRKTPLPQEAVQKPAKSRGRPKKDVSSPAAAAPKKRGRPAKDSRTLKSPAVQARRGRPAATVVSPKAPPKIDGRANNAAVGKTVPQSAQQGPAKKPASNKKTSQKSKTPKTAAKRPIAENKPADNKAEATKIKKAK